MGRLTGARPNLTPAPSRYPRTIQRPSARERGYTGRWDRTSAAFKRENPLCRGCLAMGRVEPTTVTDHVIPHRGNERLMWDPANWQPSCDWHHNVVKQALERRFEAGEIGADDLWLDSPVALEVATAERR